MKRLNLGCGPDYRHGFHNVDRDPRFRVDEVVDLEQTPWPWDDASWDDVWMFDVLEHLNDPLTAFQEAVRVTRPGGRIVVRVPHHASRNAVNDWSHKHLHWDREKLEWVASADAWHGGLPVRITDYHEERPRRTTPFSRVSGAWGNILAVYEVTAHDVPTVGN